MLRCRCPIPFIVDKITEDRSSLAQCPTCASLLKKYLFASKSLQVYSMTVSSPMDALFCSTCRAHAYVICQWKKKWAFYSACIFSTPSANSEGNKMHEIRQKKPNKIVECDQRAPLDGLCSNFTCSAGRLDTKAAN